MAPPPAALARPLPHDDDDDGPPDPDHGEAWEAEIDKRIAHDRAGRGRSFSLEELQASVRAKYGWE